MPAKRGQGKIVTKRLTKGKRKGQTIRGYVGRGGHFTELKVKTRATAGGSQTRQVGAQRTNAQKGKRKGQKFASLRDESGRTIHRYTNPKTGKTQDVVVVPKGAKTKKDTSKKSKQKPRQPARMAGPSR